MSRYKVHRCDCSCDGYVVVDRVLHQAPFGTVRSLWDAQRLAEAANRHHCPADGDGFACSNCGSTVVMWAAAS